MHRGTETAINPTYILLSLLSFAISSASANWLHDIPKHNPLNIDWYPAPSPEDGPPASANAVRDPALIPATAGAIVGAYAVFTCIVAVTVLIIKRQLRSRSQIAARALDIEMVQPGHIKTSAFTPSPLSPGGGPRNFSWPSPENDTKNPYVFPASTRLGESPITPPGTDLHVDTRIVEADRADMDRDLEDIYAHVMAQEDAKKAGVNVKEMAPPVLPMPMTSPQRKNRRPSNLNIDESKKSRASSIISALLSPRQKKTKPMNISSPLFTPLSAQFPRDEDEEPLAPRHYHPPPPPPIPTDQIPYQHSRKNSTATGPSPVRTVGNLDEQLGAMNLNPYTKHQPNPSQTSVQSSRADPLSATSTTSATPLFPPPREQKLFSPPREQKPKPAPLKTGDSGATRALPFRAFEPSIKSPSFAPTTKTTVLERTGPGHHGPNTAGLKTPWSAGAVPYSPYQPFTPLMPVTPHLVTKEERKAMKKAQGRQPVMEMVKDADDVWDSGY